MSADPALACLKLAVVGHVEWVSFVAVEQLPIAGSISHASAYLEEPAGGGAVVAVQLARLTGRRVPFFTALGRDAVGEQAVARLSELGLEMHVAWRDQPTRRGISFVDRLGERTITVIGERLTPVAADPLPWGNLAGCDGVFLTAADAVALQHARRAKLLAATPRLGLPLLEASGVQCDALIGSALDPGEQVPEGSLTRPPRLRIATEGAAGGWCQPGGRFAAVALTSEPVDSYGCGDSFAAGVTAGLAAGWPVAQALALGARCGADCAVQFGPYAPASVPPWDGSPGSGKGV
ncbi:ribokinase [Cyanobium sp. HWJ4-Hawea]|uniref:PfkB family carbohydrate kinase n=1 Tax=Cyanobium sp. HWJ4-Hawea TaxID=2823713 RepID=UPI0020CEF762|nr:PfkB family carbohydrate kinase [Cyanobium sp. HWJ4-Hawea]MCP9809673.1 ribokinase [Cyanobium sp. HWJ4-Hawea]